MKKILIPVALVATLLTSCSTYHNSMREPNTRLELQKNDFTFSEQFTAEATTTRILGIDWERLFTKKYAEVKNDNGVAFLSNVFAAPIIGNSVMDKTANYALYSIMQDHKGYDVVFYPQYETKVERPILFGFLMRKTTVKATTRLAKIKQ